MLLVLLAKKGQLTPEIMAQVPVNFRRVLERYQADYERRNPRKEVPAFKTAFKGYMGWTAADALAGIIVFLVIIGAGLLFFFLAATFR